MLEDIIDGRKSHSRVNSIEELCKIRDCIKRVQAEYILEVLSMQNMDKGLNKVFKTVSKDAYQDLPIFGESGSLFNLTIWSLQQSFWDME